jgi:hypothetical protein
MALGGSTNVVLHLLAIAREAKVELSLHDFNRIGDKTPHVADMKPFGKYVMNDVDRQGGIPVIMKAMLDEGLLHGDALTVTGGAEETRLTKTEADFLWLLATERGRLYTYGEILDVLRGGGVTTTAVLQTHMSRLKRKLGRAGEMIFNERGLGYKLLS